MRLWPRTKKSPTSVKVVGREKTAVKLPSQTDYRALLKKYIAFVTEQNGGKLIIPRDAPPFTPHDVHELTTIDEEILKEK